MPSMPPMPPTHSDLAFPSAAPSDTHEGRADSESDTIWIPVSDMMAGLMMVFLFIAVLYAQHADERHRGARDSLKAWQASERALHQALRQEFAADLPRWNAELEPHSLTIRFLSPDILFESGEARLQARFEDILQDFLPRYIRLLASFAPAHATIIDEVRIEGHTSSRWGEMEGTAAFLHNMALSQARTRSVLAYGMQLPALTAWRPWMMRHVSANGLSSARVMRTPHGSEDEHRSRRVEFRIRTRSKAQLSALMEQVAPSGRSAD